MADRQPLLRMVQIDKRFPGVHALDHVDFDLYEGEIHILLGENGAGKSTLMKIIGGAIRKDSGHIFIRGREIHDLNPELAQELGIGMVYQELSLVPGLTVAENIFLGRLPRNRLGFVNWREIYKRAQESLSSLGVEIDPRSEVRRLSVAGQQLTEIARVLTKHPQILLLDEPTSALSDTERERLFDIIRRLQVRGVGVVYVSHRLAEVPQIGQRVTVLRDGQLIGTLPVEQAEENTLIQMMVGRRLVEQFPKHEVERRETLLRVEHLSLSGILHDLSFELHKGEILAIFGLMGAGQTELARALFGLEAGITGRVLIDNGEVGIRHPADAIKHGLGYLTRDRRESLVPMLPIPPNVTLPRLSQVPVFQFLNLQKEAGVVGSFVRDLSIRPASLDRPLIYFSGGNQQKVALSRWLHSEARILIFDEPTRGIDVGAKAEMFKLMDELTQRGVGVIMISSEMPEILAMADRILVMRGGRFTAEHRRGAATQEQLLRSAN